MHGCEPSGLCSFYPIFNNQHGPLDFLGKGLNAPDSIGGKSLIEPERMVSKLARAVAARDRIQEQGGDFIVCARTDARSVTGLDDAIERASAYADAGADLIFPEGLNTAEEFKIFAEAMAPREDLFLLANMTEFGTTDIISIADFETLGYDAVIYPASSMRAAMGAVTRLFADLRATGHVKASLPDMQTRKELYETLEYTPGEEWVMPAHFNK